MLILEESEPVASDNGWTMTVRIDQIDQTPRGSRNVLKSASYNFKAGAENETAEARRKRLDVKRGARQRAFDSFEPEKLAAKKLKRRKQQHAPAAATVALQPVAAAAMQANAAPRAAAAVPHTLAAAPDVPDTGTLRDWALLRAWKELAGPEEVLEALEAQGHMDEEEQPWSAHRVCERHAFLCMCVRVSSRLVGPEASQRSQRTLANLCA
jgi:hypothetical protein